MPQETPDLHYCFFVVHERPMCLWGYDINHQNLEFIDNIDPSYFENLFQLYANAINNAEEATSEDAQHAALAMRAAYSQALETLFALLFAAIQAHWCVPAWINAYTNADLRSLVERVQTKQPVLSFLNTESPTWSDIFDFLFPTLGLEDKKHEAAVKEGFIRAWSCFATDFLDGAFVREFNSIKHGLRVRSGGFRFHIGLPDASGSPPEEMLELTGSDFGSSYLNSEKIGKWAHHVRLKSELRNWKLESIAWGLRVAAISIKNVQLSLRAINGGSPQFAFMCLNPEDLDGWKGFDTLTGLVKTIEPNFIEPFSKEHILESYKSGKRRGRIQLAFTDEEEASL